MKYQNYLFFFILISFFIFSSCALAESKNLDKSYSDGIWTVDSINNGVIMVSINGEVTHGDRLRYRIPIAGKCNLVNVVTTFLAASKTPVLEDIKNRTASALYIDEKIKITLLFSTEFIVKDTYLIWMDLGWHDVKMIKNYHDGIEKIELTIGHDDYFPAEDYLPLTTNSWSTKGMNEALDKAVKICTKKLIKNDDSIEKV